MTLSFFNFIAEWAFLTVDPQLQVPSEEHQILSAVSCLSGSSTWRKPLSTILISWLYLGGRLLFWKWACCLCPAKQRVLFKEGENQTSMIPLFGFLSWAHSRPGFTLQLPASRLGSLALSYLPYLVCQTNLLGWQICLCLVESSQEIYFYLKWPSVPRSLKYLIFSCAKCVSHCGVRNSSYWSWYFSLYFSTISSVAPMLLWGWKGNWHILCKWWVSCPYFILSHPSK